MSSDAEPEDPQTQAHPPSLPHPTSLPPSSSEPDDDDFDIDEVIRLDDERRAREKVAAAAAISVTERPTAGSLSKEGSSGRQDEGINDEDEAAWDERMVGQDVDGLRSALAPRSSQPPSEDDQDMWDVVNEIEMQMETDGGAAKPATPVAVGLVPDPQIYGNEWDEMYAS